jgi:sugar lactone lactonase YvrE
MKQNKLLFAVIFFLTTISLSVYAQLPLSNNMPANGVLGTTDFVTNTNYTAPTISTLAEPFCVAIDPTTGKLFVADRDNRRVLRWSSAAKLINGSAAEAVFGQQDFVTRTANTGGISAATMNNPNSVYVDGNGTLWVADRDNNRVLRFNNASSKSNGANADGVLGQPDFVTSTVGTTAGKMSAPASVFTDASGRLWVADRANNRVLRFDNAATKPNGGNADGVLGQSDFLTGTTGLTASTMNAPWGVHVDVGGRLWVAERTNNRVLRFDNAAAKPNGSAANGVLGQTDFTTGTVGLTQSKFDGPRGVFVDGLGRLYVGDEGNSRIIVFTNAASLANGANATYVLGQPDFITNAALDPPTSSSLSYPSTMFSDDANNDLWVPDTYNHRILRYDVSPLPVELVSFTATVRPGKVELNWSTATEVDNYGFEIERKTSDNWVKIAFVRGSGNSNSPKNYSFTENTLAGKYQYRLKQVDHDGTFEYSNVVEVTVGLTVEDYTLGQNYPNPFNPSTTITFAMANTEHVTITVHNMLGQEVETLFNGIAIADQLYSLSFDAKNLSSGIYFYTLHSANRNEIRKMSLMK